MSGIRKDVLEMIGIRKAELETAKRTDPRILELCRDLEVVGDAMNSRREPGLAEKTVDLELIRLERELIEEVRVALTRTDS